MDYDQQRRDLVAQGRSNCGRIAISVRGMQSWLVRIAPGTVRQLDEEQFAARLREAAGELIRDQFAGIRVLKSRIYG
ncbi:hypothetical protein [Plantactinospora sp. KBS50]|uniref:hypothetical protein n=1 Tax=Plantactinospora sp. KBS50 TaxID=2024580 RepID=UPI000BAA9DCF|nr:hypothetical protein [Plantactinospora sp. KBS50]ASW55514.1 hypothetical protein CIK06_17045 [Plantactinospora sp. KBS50]